MAEVKTGEAHNKTRASTPLPEVEQIIDAAIPTSVDDLTRDEQLAIAVRQHLVWLGRQRAAIEAQRAGGLNPHGAPAADPFEKQEAIYRELLAELES